MIYEHFKGNKYRLLGYAKHTETGNNLVIYAQTKDNKKHSFSLFIFNLFFKFLNLGEIWVRPVDMFFENVVVNDKEVPRFFNKENEDLIKNINALKNGTFTENSVRCLFVDKEMENSFREIQKQKNVDIKLNKEKVN